MAETALTSLADMDEAIIKVVGAYRSNVLDAIAKSADEAANIFIGEASKASPPFEGESKGSPRYRDCWAIKDRPKAKYVRSVGNSKKVKGKNNSSIPLINILEFSTVRGRPHVEKAIQNSKSQIFDLFQNNVEKVGK